MQSSRNLITRPYLHKNKGRTLPSQPSYKYRTYSISIVSVSFFANKECNNYHLFHLPLKISTSDRPPVADSGKNLITYNIIAAHSKSKQNIYQGFCDNQPWPDQMAFNCIPSHNPEPTLSQWKLNLGMSQVVIIVNIQKFKSKEIYNQFQCLH